MAVQLVFLVRMAFLGTIMGTPFYEKIKRRKKRRPKRLRKPELTTKEILTWIDEHYRRTGRWPSEYSGPIAGTLSENWNAVNAALNQGNRGLEGKSSLAKLLAEKRGVRNKISIPALSLKQILAWADKHHTVTGSWPTAGSGEVIGIPGENWRAIGMALRQGGRGLPSGYTLATLLEAERGVRNRADLLPLTIRTILSWADGYFSRTGKWPTADSGLIPEAPGETWNAVESALRSGRRGFPGDSSLAKVLEKHRKVRNIANLQRLTYQMILAWADQHFERTGEWPTALSGFIFGTNRDKWKSVNAALIDGRRGLPGESSLAKLLSEHRGFRSKSSLQPLKLGQILRWADAFHRRTGTWPNHKSGPIPEAPTPEETWARVCSAFQGGYRGLPLGYSLAQLLAERRGVRNKQGLPTLTEKQIRLWARKYYRKTGQWPTTTSGPIMEAPGETWKGVDSALREGCRGFAGGFSLARLLKKFRQRGAGR